MIYKLCVQLSVCAWWKCFTLWIIELSIWKMNSEEWWNDANLWKNVMGQNSYADISSIVAHQNECVRSPGCILIQKWLKMKIPKVNCFVYYSHESNENVWLVICVNVNGTNVYVFVCKHVCCMCVDGKQTECQKLRKFHVIVARFVHIVYYLIVRVHFHEKIECSCAAVAAAGFIIATQMMNKRNCYRRAQLLRSIISLIVCCIVFSFIWLCAIHSFRYLIDCILLLN